MAARIYAVEDCLITTHPDLAVEWADTNGRGPHQLLPASTLIADWICGQCGCKFEKAIHLRTRSTTAAKGCPDCYAGLKHTVKAINGNTLAELHPEVAAMWSDSNKMGPDRYTPQSIQKVWWNCPEGHHYKGRVESRVNGKGCPECAGVREVSDQHNLAAVYPHLMVEWADTNVLDPSLVHPKSAKDADWVCWVCGYKWTARILHRANGQDCVSCMSVMRKLHPGVTDIITMMPDKAKQYSRTLNKRDPAMYSYGSFQQLWWECADCDTEWQASPSTRSVGLGDCPKCYPPGRSRAENELAAIFMGWGLTISQSNRQVIRPREIDIYLPDLRIGVEFHGVYWHSRPDTDPGYHASKLASCSEVSVRLIQVWEDDWNLRRDAVIKMLAHALGVADQLPPDVSRTVLTGQCSTAEVGHKEATVFLDTHHIDGSRRSSIYLGMRDRDGILVALLSARIVGPDCKIDRYASSCDVRDGFGHLASALKRLLGVGTYGHIERIVAISNSEHCDGSQYLDLGWSLEEVLSPEYQYVIGDRRFHKSYFRRERFQRDPDLLYREGASESELAEMNGIVRAYDSGKRKYVMTQ